MAGLNIPERNRDGLIKLLTLSPNTFDKFVDALQAQSPQMDLPLRLAQTIIVSDVEKPDLEPIVRAVTALYFVRASADTALDRFVNDVSKAIQSFNPIGGSNDSKERLRKVLSIKPLMIASKAVTIFTDHQRTLHAAKILTDIRYAFQSDPEQEPYGAVIVHTLKLAYHEDGRHKDFYVAMDGDDLARLGDIVKRARAKSETLRRKLDAAGSTYLGSTDEENE